MKDKLKVLLIEAMAEFATEEKTRAFGADCSDITKKYHKKLLALISQERERLLKVKIGELYKFYKKEQRKALSDIGGKGK